MAQETDLWEKETSTKTDRTNERKYDEAETGRDKPRGDGGVGDEQVNRIGRDDSDKPTGQDHSTENHEQLDPTDGVGAIQESSDTTSDIAHIDD
jgi:bisphosphoglycerate-dependent phosphoglycerate mutase